MMLAPLPPDLTFVPLDRTAAGSAFAFAVKSAALGPHIAARWGWDDAVQRRFHEQRFAEKPFLRIDRVGVPIGVLSFEIAGDHVRFGEFYLLPEVQNQGLGSAILAHCLMQADALNLPVRLEYLYWNPVGSLYRRHGFVETGRTDIHVLMERQPEGTQRP